MKKHNIVLKASLSLVFTVSFFVPNEYAADAKNFSVAPALSNAISGIVYDDKRNPLPEVIVELQNDLYSTVGRTRTDPTGRYFFAGMSAGRYKIRVLPFKYNLEEQTLEVEVINFSFSVAGRSRDTSDNVMQDFYLRPRRNALLGFGVTGAIFVQEIPKDAQKFYEKGLEDLANDKANEGIANLENAVKIFPRYYLALNRLGFEKLNRNEFQTANEVLAVAAEVNPKDVGTLYMLAYSLHKSKRSDSALEVLNYCMTLNSSVPRVLLLSGEILRIKKQYKEAEEQLKKAEKLDKNELPDIHWQLALLYESTSRFNEAANELELFLKAQPKSKDAENIKKLIKQFREKAVGKSG